MSVFIKTSWNEIKLHTKFEIIHINLTGFDVSKCAMVSISRIGPTLI
jgi:hypothetical protein